MSAIALRVTRTVFNPKWLLFVVFLIAVALVLNSVGLLPSAKETITVNGQEIVIHNQNHAVVKHGDGAIMSRRCFDHHGTWDVFMAQFDKDNTFHLICRDSLGNFYARVIERIKDNVFREKTAYQYGSRVWNQIKSTILRSGEYVRFKGPLVPLP